MRFSRALAVVLALAALLPASAQAQPNGTRGRSAACQELLSLRNEVGKYSQAIQAASRKKAGAGQLCKLFSVFTAAEDKMLKALEERRVVCGVPARVIDQLKAGHGRATQLTERVCEVAQGQPTGLMPTEADRSSCDGLWGRLSCPMGGEP